MGDKPIDILFVSDSRLLIDGLSKVLQDEPCIRVTGDLSTLASLKQSLKKKSPDYIFFDQRVRDKEIERFLVSHKNKTKGIEIILLCDEEEVEDCPTSFITVNQDTSASELVDIIKNRRELQKDVVEKNAIIKEVGTSVTNTESRIIDLITLGTYE